jgi:hypothetical protein
MSRHVEASIEGTLHWPILCLICSFAKANADTCGSLEEVLIGPIGPTQLFGDSPGFNKPQHRVPARNRTINDLNEIALKALQLLTENK